MSGPYFVLIEVVRLVSSIINRRLQSRIAPDPFPHIFKVSRGEVGWYGRNAGRMQAPASHCEGYEAQAEDEYQWRHDPRYVVEGSEARRCQRGRPIFILKVNEDGLIRIAMAYGRHKLSAHCIRIRTADVIAFAQQLIATAGTHDLVRKLVVPSRGIAGTRDEEDDQANQQELEEAAALK